MLHAHQSISTTYYHYYSAIEQTVTAYKKLQTSFIVNNQFLLLHLRIQIPLYTSAFLWVELISIHPYMFREPDRATVININIKTSNKILANIPENIPLRALKPSDSKTGEWETRSTHCLHPSRSSF